MINRLFFIIVLMICFPFFSCNLILDENSYNKLKYGIDDTQTNSNDNAEDSLWSIEDNSWVKFETNNTLYEDLPFLKIVDDSSMTLFDVCEIKLITERCTGGIVFCYQNSMNYYRFSITPSGGGYDLYTVINGVETRRSGGSSGWVHESGENDLKAVQTEAGVFHIYVNGFDHTVLNDATFQGGKSGYYVKVSSYVTTLYKSSCKFQMITPIVNP